MDDSTAAVTLMTTAVSGVTTAVTNAIANAVKASGAIVKVEPEDFSRILSEVEAPLVIICPVSGRKGRLKYLTSWKGFVFHTVSKQQLNLPGNSRIIAAKKIWIPG